MPSPRPSLRPRLSRRIVAYVCADLFGLFATVIGATWFISHQPAILATFPGNLAEAVACTASGLVIMCWGAAHVVKALSNPPPRASDARLE